MAEGAEELDEMFPEVGGLLVSEIVSGNNVYGDGVHQNEYGIDGGQVMGEEEHVEEGEEDGGDHNEIETVSKRKVFEGSFEANLVGNEGEPEERTENKGGLVDVVTDSGVYDEHGKTDEHEVKVVTNGLHGIRQNSHDSPINT